MRKSMFCVPSITGVAESAACPTFSTKEEEGTKESSVQRESLIPCLSEESAWKTAVAGGQYKLIPISPPV